MYFLNEQQINSRLQFMEELAGTCRDLNLRWRDGDSVLALAQERVLHLAIESVTDIGSLLIDAFILRDASSYEDIVEILRGENAFTAEVAERLLELVKLRRPLVQDYVNVERGKRHPLMEILPDLLPLVVNQIRAFMRNELGFAGEQSGAGSSLN